MKNIVNIIVKVAIVLFVLSLFSEYLNDIPELKSFAKLNYDSTYTKITFCIGYLFFAYYLRTNKVKRISTNNIIVIGIVYSLYRFNAIPHIEWRFAYLCQPIYYLDGIYPLLLFLLYGYTKPKTIDDSNKPKRNVIDAISTEADDKFGFYNDAKQLVELILTQQSIYQDSSMIIGLRGEWGEGKTSYLNMLELYAKKHKVQEINVMRFNPWYSNSYEQMVKDLFVEFSNMLGYDITNKEFSSYTKALSDADIGVWSKIAKFIHRSQEKTLTDLHDQLNNIIKLHSNINIVLIDDLDRLSEIEILNVFKLIRNNANFAKTVFIVSYDYEYIKGTLTGIMNFDKYIEKIFPCPYVLPECKKDDVKQLKKSRMLDIIHIDNRYEQLLDEFIDNTGDKLSLRNAQRVALQVAYNISNLKDKDGNLMVNLCDYLSLSYLSIVAPNVYKNIAHTDEQFRSNDVLVNHSGCLYMNFDQSLFSMYHKEEERKYITQETYINKLKALELNECIANDVFSILCKMFNRSDAKSHDVNRKLFRLTRVSDYRTLPMFFTRDTDQKLLTKAEFDDGWNNASGMSFDDSIKLWVTKYDQYSLSYQIANMHLTTKEDWIQAFDAVINIYPSSVLERFKNSIDHNILRYVTIPGEYMVEELQRNSDEFFEYMEALCEYMQNIESDKVDKVYKKYVMLNSLFIREILSEVHYINSSIENDSNGYNNWKVLPSFDLNKAREENIVVRLSMLDSYDEFDSEYWFACHNFDFDAKLRIRKLFTSHIANNIDSFITNYSVDIVENDMFISKLFYKYEVNGCQASANEKEWMPYFIFFLESLDAKDERIGSYIEEIRNLMKTRNN